jgi:hypothetical protein
MRKKLRRAKFDPRFEKSSTDNVEPIREMPNTARFDPSLETLRRASVDPK